MDKQSIRGAFAAFVGDEQFRKFLRSSRPAGRPLFWHEQAWRRFVVACPDSTVSFEEFRAALRFCERHELDLMSGPVGAWHCPACQEEEEAEQARRRELPPSTLEMMQPRRVPHEGIAISDLIDALRAIDASEEIINKRILGTRLVSDETLFIRTGGSTGGDLAILRRTESGWVISDFTQWCS